MHKNHEVSLILLRRKKSKRNKEGTSRKYLPLRFFQELPYLKLLEQMNFDFFQESKSTFRQKISFWVESTPLRDVSNQRVARAVLK